MARRIVLPGALLLTALLVACKSGDDAVDGTHPADGALEACLERPGGLPRPPQGRLPCELIPPGLAL